jgi:hypothetical protein
VWSGGEEMLEVVEHEQVCSLPEDTNELLSHRLITDIPETKRVGDGGDNGGGIADGGEVNPHDSIDDMLGDIMCNCLGQARLADATGTGERQQRDRVIEQEGLCSTDLRLAPDEPGAGDRKRSE